MMDTEKARFNLIQQQLRPAKVLAPKVLDLFSDVDRQDFVPPAYRSLAYSAASIPLGHGAHMFPPLLEARALEALLPRRHEKVLEIGTGSGYMAALLGARGASVLTYEIEPELAAMARANLDHIRAHRVEIVTGDGLKPRPTADGFHVIMMSGAVAEVPRAILDLLKPGGRLFAITGQHPVLEATLIRRAGDHLVYKGLFETNVDYLRGAEPKPNFVF
jgi:protein-L-isoaspartate(D-aspartate) O-methyltransferase